MALSVLSVAYPFAPVGPDAVGGAEQVLSALDAALVAAVHRSLVVAQEGSRTAGRLLPVPAEPGPIGTPERVRAWAAHRRAIARALGQERVDVVHLHGIDFYEYLPAEVPALATLHLPLDWYPPSAFVPRPGLWLHGVSAAQYAGRPEGARLMPPIPNGVSPRLFSTRARKRGYALLLARICPEKGIHLALEAAHRADVPLFIGGAVFGYTEHQRYFAEQVAPRLDRRRRFLGPLGFDRKRRLLAAAACLLVPSLAAETSSLAAIEALACGTPVIAFPAGALAGLVRDGVTGFLVRDVAGMAAAIPATRGLDPQACRAAAAEFSLARMTAGYLACYAALACSRSRWSGAVGGTKRNNPG